MDEISVNNGIVMTRHRCAAYGDLSRILMEGCTLVRKLVGTALLASVISSAAFAEGHVALNADAAVKARDAQMEMISYHLGILGGMAKGDIAYDQGVAAAAAGNLEAAASMNPAVLWPEGSDSGSNGETRAKPEIWSDWDGFLKNVQDLQAATSAMAESAGVDLAALQSAIGPVGGTCGACHRGYRGPER